MISVGQRIIQHQKVQSGVIFFTDQDKDILLPTLVNHAQVKEYATVSVSSTWQWHSLYTGTLVTKHSNFKLLEGVALVLFTVHTAQEKYQVMTKTYIKIRHC